MKTRIYVDGYNLYYGCLKNTPFKWLDLVKLFENQILPSTLPPGYSVTSVDIRYFTASISGKAARDDNSVKDQENYHRALTALYTQAKLNIIYGYFSVTDVFAYKVDDEQPKKEPRYCERVKIWKLEEKQTDVNIAIEALYDALTDNSLEQLIFVTNDTDIAPVLEKIKVTTNLKVGVIVPTKKASKRRPSEKLTSKADWHRSSIDAIELRNSQMPRVITSSVNQKLRKPIIKPVSWYGQAAVLTEIISLLLPCMKQKRNLCWQWLESEKPPVPGLPLLPDVPINLMENKEQAEVVLQHAIKYVQNCAKTNNK